MMEAQLKGEPIVTLTMEIKRTDGTRHFVTVAAEMVADPDTLARLMAEELKRHFNPTDQELDTNG